MSTPADEVLPIVSEANDTLVLALCDKLCGNDNDVCLSLLHDVMATLHQRMNISAAKADGGTTGEHWIAQHFGLQWQAGTKTGFDALDEQHRGCEIKASLHPLKSKLKTAKTNICYATPSRRNEESDDEFVQRTQEHICQSTGGNYWGTWQAKIPDGADDRIVLRWWVPSEPLAQLIGKKMRQSKYMQNKSGTVPINFGAVVCRECMGVHRVDRIVETLGGWNGRTDTIEQLKTLRLEKHHVKLTDEELDALDNGSCASQC